MIDKGAPVVRIFSTASIAAIPANQNSPKGMLEIIKDPSSRGQVYEPLQCEQGTH
jgi:hypothetical protein